MRIPSTSARGYFFASGLADRGADYRVYRASGMKRVGPPVTHFAIGSVLWVGSVKFYFRSRSDDRLLLPRKRGGPSEKKVSAVVGAAESEFEHPK